MTEEELREMFAALEAQGLRPMLCDILKYSNLWLREPH